MDIFGVLLVCFRGVLVICFLSFRSLKSVTPLFGILISFGVFISVKCGGLFNKFNTYILRSLDSSLFSSLYIGRDFITLKPTTGLDFSLL